MNQPTYGYSLVKKFRDSEISIETNTRYSLMRRLETQGVLKSDRETSGSKLSKLAEKYDPDSDKCLIGAPYSTTAFGNIQYLFWGDYFCTFVRYNNCDCKYSAE